MQNNVKRVLGASENSTNGTSNSCRSVILAKQKNTTTVAATAAVTKGIFFSTNRQIKCKEKENGIPRVLIIEKLNKIQTNKQINK